MSRSRAKAKRPEPGSAKNRAREIAPVRPKGLWQAGNRAVSRVIGQMQQSFGEDFSNVEIDASPQARESAASLGAAAVTSGDTILLGPAAPALESERGERLLAHELTHIVQQRRASTVDTHGVSPAADSFEHTANHGASQAPYGRSVDVASGGHVPGMQREATPDAVEEQLRKIRESRQHAALPQQADLQPSAPLGPRTGAEPQPLVKAAKADEKVKQIDAKYKNAGVPSLLKPQAPGPAPIRDPGGRTADETVQAENSAPSLKAHSISVSQRIVDFLKTLFGK